MNYFLRERAQNHEATPTLRYNKHFLALGSNFATDISAYLLG